MHYAPLFGAPRPQVEVAAARQGGYRYIYLFMHSYVDISISPCIHRYALCPFVWCPASAGRSISVSAKRPAGAPPPKAGASPMEKASERLQRPAAPVGRGRLVRMLTIPAGLRRWWTCAITTTTMRAAAAMTAAVTVAVGATVAMGAAVAGPVGVAVGLLRSTLCTRAGAGWRGGGGAAPRWWCAPCRFSRSGTSRCTHLRLLPPLKVPCRY